LGSISTHNTPDRARNTLCKSSIAPWLLCKVLAHGDRAAPLPARFANSELRLVLEWARQEYILSHPKERLSAGVPIICWPLQYDQRILAIIITQVLGAGYQLHKVRGGPLGMQPRKNDGKVPVGTVEAVQKEAREVLHEAFFEAAERAKVQERVGEVCNKFRAAWDSERLLEFI
jgi:hypothetical protein